MTNTPLRLYNREIETLIDRGQTEEAIAHCLHILQVYPKHIETYRLLGKSFLESQRYTDAADIFQRVLAAIPDDFISHIGMSIVREDEGNLDAAIWHMERSFEVQPGNAAIQDELRRLYGRRDGVEPPRVRLTRGSLVRMYARGNLYQQAIAEVKAALEEDPHRPDLQVLLASLYYQSGQRIEAAEACSQILNKYPYCLEANRILADILPGTGRAEDAEIYQQRVCSLDPYAAFTSTSSPSPSEVPDNAINIERLEYQPGKAPAPAQPQWAASLGIDLGEPSESAQKTPDWLTAIEKGVSNGESPTTPPPFVTSEQPFSEPAQPAAEAPEAKAEDISKIPDWMQAAGWTPATTPVDESQISALEATGDEELTEAELPDWVRAMAPAGDEAQESAEIPEGFVPAEIDDTGQEEGTAEEPSESAAAEPALDQTEIPEQLEPEALEQGAQPPAEQAVEETPVAESKTDLPDWVAAFGHQPAAETPAHPEEKIEAAEELPDWLRDAQPPPETAADIHRATSGLEESPVIPEEQPEIMPSPDETATPIGQADQEGGFTWQDSLAAEQGIGEEALPMPPEDRPQMPSGWFQEEAGEVAESTAEPESAGENQPLEDTTADTQEVHVRPIGQVSPAEVEATTPQEDLPEWLKSFATDVSGEMPSGLDTGPSETAGEDLPDWIQSAGLVDEAVHKTTIPPPSAEDVPDWLRELQAPEEEPGTGEQPASPEDSQQVFDTAGLETETPAAVSGEAESPIAEEWATIPSEETVPGTTEPLENMQSIETTPSSEAAPQPTAFEEAGLEGFQAIDQETSAVTGEVEPPVIETGAVSGQEPTAADQEAAIAWLEGLAARQGAMEEELFVQPEERTTTPPDWIKEALSEGEKEATPESEIAESAEAVEAEAQGAVAEIEPQAEITAAVETIETEIPGATIEIEREAEIAAPAETVETETEGAAAELETKAEMPAVTEAIDTETSSPGEVSAVEMAAPFAQPEEGETPSGQTPEEEITMPEPEDSGQTKPDEKSPGAVNAGVELPDWLKGIEVEPRGGQSEETAASTKDLPAWLQQMDEPSKVEEPAPSQAEAGTEELPEWLQGLGEQPSGEVEEAATASETTAEAPWLDMQAENAEESGLFTAEAPGKAAKASESGWKPEEIGLPPAPPAAEPAPVDFTTILVQAQTSLSQGQLHGALQDYAHLIQANQFLDNVIFDLRQSIYQHPADQELWQTLGDAYMRADRLQDALNAYTKAEELLQ
jgi:tetratricopeptide (TPR) repeat protein